MSILIKKFITNTEQVFNLSIISSLAVIEVLKSLGIPDLSIKWPNDIMSYNKKIGGILIENTIKSDSKIVSIVGLGLNVNQANFVELPNASSLYLITGNSFDKEILLDLIAKKIENKINSWENNLTFFWEEYFNTLFRRGIPMPFKNTKNENFMGIITGVTPSGKLQIQLEDDSINEFDIKEVTMLY